eukprot:9345010-Lingulodinium_polyedra.AAC.1
MSIATSRSSSPTGRAPAGGGGTSRGSGTTGPGSGTCSRISAFLKDRRRSSMASPGSLLKAA